jgi:hypothetical protein
MSDDNFVSRWSRLKGEAAQRRKLRRDPEASEAREGEPRDERSAEALDEAAGEARKPESPLDPAMLPPIDSIVAGSDIRAFLQKGVPADLTRAALRRAWTSDPAIRDFIGLAENQWNFTDPTAIPGFGALNATDNVGQLVAQAMGKLTDVPDAVGLSEERRKGATSGDGDVSLEAPAQKVNEEQPPIEAIALQQPELRQEDEPAPVRRGHGRALPR